MGEHILKNEVLTVTVSDASAELCSVLDMSKGERIWTADPSIWNRHAPILFPFVGRAAGGVYRVGGKEYAMKTQHGFARDIVFDCVEQSETAVRHVLTDTPQTREIYPFPFRLEVTHELDADDPRLLHVTWSVRNCGDERMYYAIGGHPGFLLSDGISKQDCAIRFPGKETLRYFGVGADGLALPDQTHELQTKDGAVPFQTSLYDTWIFEKQGIDAVEILGPDGRALVTLNCPQFPLLAVWAKESGPFICLEPWYGRTDDSGFAGSLEEKPQEQSLEPGETRVICWSMAFHE